MIRMDHRFCADGIAYRVEKYSCKMDEAYDEGPSLLFKNNGNRFGRI